MVRWFWLICLSAGALEDIKCRAVSGKLLAVCGLAGMAAAWSGGLGTHVPGLSAGMAVLAVSGLTRGAVGAGDGLFLLASAWYLTAAEVWLFLAGGLVVSWVWSAAVILKKIFAGRKHFPHLRRILTENAVSCRPAGGAPGDPAETSCNVRGKQI